MRRLLEGEFLRYFGASLIALAVDFALLLSLATFMHYLLAATISFLAGSLTHYILAIRLVFRTRRLQEQAHLEGLLFVVAGLAGLLVNAIVIYAMVEWMSAPLYLAKLIAAGGSFMAGFVSRKVLLFS